MANRPGLSQLRALIAVAALLASCSRANVLAERDISPVSSTVPALVYVADFELDAAEVKSEPGILNELPRPRILPEVLPRGPLTQNQNPHAEARRIVDLMARSIAEDLEKKGVAATRVAAGFPPPTAGWLVRGMFLEVDEGNRLRRAVIGFGVGQTRMEVAATTDDLAKGAPAPLYQLETDAHSGSLPGAAITLNPVVAGLRFVMAGQDLDKNVRETAAKIADEVEKRVESAAAAGQGTH